MNKYILTLLLTSCVPPIKDPSPTQLEAPSAPLSQDTAEGSVYGVDWFCAQKEINDALVWIDCVFKNNNTNTTVYNFCIEAAFFKESNGIIVAGKRLCESIIAPGEIKTGYVAFTKELRKKLNVCGPMLERCVMLAPFSQQ